MSEENEFPKSIEGFGYKFNEKGELRNINTDERFLFHVKPEDLAYNQRYYEELCAVVGEFIENELVEKYNLIRQIIPVGSEEDDSIAKSRIYLSNDAQECQTLLLLIQGTGAVRPGQWARQVIINDSLELGSMFPYVRKAQELKWGIIIFNPNENYKKVDQNVCYISGSESAQEHCCYVWNKFVKNAKAKKILIVAHSYGGICTADMLDHFADEFKSRVKGIALTDSVHSSGMIPEDSKKWFNRNAINWIKSPLPLDDYVPEAKKYYECSCFSAGHPKHEYTSGMAIESVFEFLKGRSKEKYDKVTTDQENETDSQVASAMETVDKAEMNTQTQEVNSEKDDKASEEPQIDSTMEIDDESPMNAQTLEVSSFDTESQLDSIVDESSKATVSSEKGDKASEEPRVDSTMEIDDKSPMNAQSSFDTESQLDSIVEESSKATISSEKGDKASEEPQADSTMEIDYKSSMNAQSSFDTESQLDSIADESSKAAISSEKDIVASEEPHINSAMKIIDDELPKTAIVETTKSFTSNEISEQQEEPKKEKVVVNNIIIESNTSENKVVINNDVPNEMGTDLESVQQIKDNNIQKNPQNNTLTSD